MRPDEGLAAKPFHQLLLTDPVVFRGPHNIFTPYSGGIRILPKDISD